MRKLLLPHINISFLHFRRAKNYFALRKYTFSLLLFSIVIAIICTIFVAELFRIDRPRTSLHLITFDDEITISQIIVNIYYRGNGHDSLDVRVYFDIDAPSTQGGSFLLSASENIKRVSNFSSTTMQRDASFPDDGKYYYSFGTSEEPSLLETFEGNIFGRNSQALNLQFDLNVNYTGFEVEGIKQLISIQDIYGITVDRIYPQPSEQSPFGLIFEYDPIIDELSPNMIRMSAFNSDDVYQYQLRFFIIGTILGIFVSIASSIVVDEIKHLEVD